MTLGEGAVDGKVLTFNGSSVWVFILAHKLAMPGPGYKWTFKTGW